MGTGDSVGWVRHTPPQRIFDDRGRHGSKPFLIPSVRLCSPWVYFPCVPFSLPSTHIGCVFSRVDGRGLPNIQLILLPFCFPFAKATPPSGCMKTSFRRRRVRWMSSNTQILIVSNNMTRAPHKHGCVAVPSTPQPAGARPLFDGVRPRGTTDEPAARDPDHQECATVPLGAETRGCVRPRRALRANQPHPPRSVRRPRQVSCRWRAGWGGGAMPRADAEGSYS